MLLQNGRVWFKTHTFISTTKHDNTISLYFLFTPSVISITNKLHQITPLNHHFSNKITLALCVCDGKDRVNIKQ